MEPPGVTHVDVLSGSGAMGRMPLNQGGEYPMLPAAATADVQSMLAHFIYLRALAAAIRELYGTSVVHLQTALLHADELPWTGKVEVFAIMGTAESRRCFAWPNSEGEAVVLLATAEVNSPEDAVRAYYAGQPQR
jgi:hypothetical protein